MRYLSIRVACRILIVQLCALLILTSDLIAADETVCLQCHAGQPGRLSEPIGLWEQSVHHENGISCHDCHGGDPTDFGMAMSPERGFVGVPSAEGVPAFCGQCHVGIKEDYDLSKHGKALGAGGPNCVTCHSNHKVKRASLALINDVSCSQCHEYGRAVEIKEALSSTDERIELLDAELTELHKKGIATSDMEGKLFSLRNEYHQLFHSVDVDQVVAQSTAFQLQLDEISVLAKSNQNDLGQRKVFGAVLVALLVLAGILLLMLKRTYEGGD